MSKSEKIKTHKFNCLANKILEHRRITDYNQTEKHYFEESQEELYPLDPQKCESLIEYQQYLEEYDKES